jgi:hypothetical protein
MCLVSSSSSGAKLTLREASRFRFCCFAAASSFSLFGRLRRICRRAWVRGQGRVSGRGTFVGQTDPAACPQPPPYRARRPSKGLHGWAARSLATAGIRILGSVRRLATLLCAGLYAVRHEWPQYLGMLAEAQGGGRAREALREVARTSPPRASTTGYRVHPVACPEHMGAGALPPLLLPGDTTLAQQHRMQVVMKSLHVHAAPVLRTRLHTRHNH